MQGSGAREVAAHTRTREASTITFDQLTRCQLPAQPCQGHLALDGGTKEFAVPVLVQLKVEVPLRKIAKLHHLARFDDLSEHHVC